jgi:hypothetical protein
MRQFFVILKFEQQVNAEDAAALSDLLGDTVD